MVLEFLQYRLGYIGVFGLASQPVFLLVIWLGIFVFAMFNMENGKGTVNCGVG